MSSEAASHFIQPPASQASTKYSTRIQAANPYRQATQTGSIALQVDVYGVVYKKVRPKQYNNNNNNNNICRIVHHLPTSSYLINFRLRGGAETCLAHLVTLLSCKQLSLLYFKRTRCLDLDRLSWSIEKRLKSFVLICKVGQKLHCFVYCIGLGAHKGSRCRLNWKKDSQYVTVQY